jgi:hypothetical protein
VRQIIQDYLELNPGTTKDRIYDEVVSRMVRSGQIEAHDFSELLTQVAIEVKTPILKNLFEQKAPDLFGAHEISRWYLKETELAISDVAEMAREDAAAENLVYSSTGISLRTRVRKVYIIATYLSILSIQ